MGIDGLYKFINRNIPDVYSTIGINEIRGQSCIIDGMQHIYSQLIYMRSKGKEIINKNGQNISHIYGLLNSLTYYLKNGIIPIFIFDGKAPDIKRKKIDERRKNLKENLKKLKDLEKEKNLILELINVNTKESDNLSDIEFLIDTECIGEQVLEADLELDINSDKNVFGTPPNIFDLDEEMKKINSIQDEYRKIYKKSIILKDYFITDWIMILEYLGLPVVKAKEEADPLCAHILKNNLHISGIISDDSDMLIFGSPVLMRKCMNQQFTIIELTKLINKIKLLLEKIFDKYIDFTMDNLIDFAILLGTDYGTFKLNDNLLTDSLEILKYYILNGMDVKKIISEEQIEHFLIIKKYYSEFNLEENLKYLLDKPFWNKPKLLELKLKLLEFDVDEDYIDKNNQIIDKYFNKFTKINKYKNKYNNTKFYYKKYSLNNE
jgi:5'-3' exonuclease